MGRDGVKPSLRQGDTETRRWGDVQHTGVKSSQYFDIER